MDSLYVAMVLTVAILVASMVSVELALSVSIIEIILGVALGNALGLSAPEWLVFLAGLGAILLAFLAGAEVDPGEFRATWRANIAIGVLSFASPFFGAMLACRFLFDWTWQQAQIGGIALSTTSLAVVYAVLVESGLNATRIGKLIMSATFVTDLGTVAALSLLFITPSWWLMPFAAASVALIIGMPKLDSWFFVRYGNRVIEPEFKGALAALLVLMWLAAARWGTRSTPPHVRVPGRPAIQDGQMPGRDIALDPSVDQAPVPAHAARTSGGREPRPARKSV